MNKLTCYYALSGINYKNSTVTCCPRQADQLVFQKDTIIPSEIYNHNNFKKLRKSLDVGIWPNGCDTCEEMEKNNLKSMRHDFRIPMSNWLEIQKKYNVITGEMSKDSLTHIELRFSNACNFSCLHCSDIYSSKWANILKTFKQDNDMIKYDLKQLLGTEHRHGDDDNLSIKMTINQIDDIVDDLCKNFPNLQLIDVAGGEPLFQKQFWHALKKLTEHPNAKNIIFSFHSNFNTDCDIDYLSHLLKKFKRGVILISIDGGENIYPYFRKGGKWSQLVKNINKIKKIDQKTHIVGTCTTSAYQILDIKNVFESMLSLDLIFDASIVQTPKYINPSILNYDFFTVINEDFDEVMNYINSKLIGKKKMDAIHWFNYIKKYTNETKIGYKHYNRFLVYIQKTDKIWECDFNNFYQNYRMINGELERI